MIFGHSTRGASQICLLGSRTCSLVESDVPIDNPKSFLTIRMSRIRTVIGSLKKVLNLAPEGASLVQEECRRSPTLIDMRGNLRGGLGGYMIG